MKTQPFRAYIKQLQYNTYEFDTKLGHQVQYYIQANLLEIKQGRFAQKTYHTAMIYITEEQYNNRELNVMDKIEINENAQWINSYFSLNIYDKKKLEEYDSSRLLRDDKGRTYAKVHFNAYTLKVKPEDWKLIERADQACYIQCGKVKFYIDETQVNDETYCFFFDQDTYDKIVENNMQVIDMICYLHRQIKWKNPIELQTAFDDSSSRYFANLIVKEEGK